MNAWNMDGDNNGVTVNSWNKKLLVARVFVMLGFYRKVVLNKCYPPPNFASNIKQIDKLLFPLIS